jgi:hypothetical protein
MNVAVPLPKHSLRFGQAASSQTVDSLFLRRIFLIACTFGEGETRILIHSGLRKIFSLGITLTGMRSTFSALRSFSPFFIRFVR